MVDKGVAKSCSKMFSHCQALVALAFVLPAALTVEQTAPTCNDVGLCFETAELDVMGVVMTIGFAMPPFEDNEGEVLVSTSIPVPLDSIHHVVALVPLDTTSWPSPPYGFVAFNTGYDVDNTEINITKETVVTAPFTDEINEAETNPPPLNLSEVRVQVSVIGDDDQLLPMNGTNAITTVSHLSRREPSTVQLLYRFRSPQLLASDQLHLVQPGLTRIIGAFSMNAPEYLDASEQQAVLYLNGSQSFAFVLNSTAAVYQNYSSMLEVAGVN